MSMKLNLESNWLYWALYERLHSFPSATTDAKHFLRIKELIWILPRLHSHCNTSSLYQGPSRWQCMAELNRNSESRHLEKEHLHFCILWFKRHHDSRSSTLKRCELSSRINKTYNLTLLWPLLVRTWPWSCTKASEVERSVINWVSH